MGSCGRLGRLGTSTLKQLQYRPESGPALSHHHIQGLLFHRDLVCAVPPRSVPLRTGRKALLVGYTDAEFTKGRQPRIGAVLFRPPPLLPLGLTSLLSRRITDAWLQRENQILWQNFLRSPC